jgi:hypothetical protein
LPFAFDGNILAESTAPKPARAATKKSR